MSQIERYILRQVVFAGAIVLACLTCAIWLTQSLRFIELIVNRGLGIAAYFYLTFLLLPSFLSLLLPISLFVAVLFTYSRLTTDSELVVMRAIGFGPARLSRPALALGALVVLAGYSFSLYFLPVTYREFKELEHDIRTDYSGVLLREGVFNTVSDGITIYIRAREPNGDLLGIIVHDNRTPGRTITIMAERGTLTVTDEGPRLIMVDGNRQQMERDSGKLSLLLFDRYTADLGRVGEKTGERWREPRERFLGELFYNDGSEADRLFANKLSAEGHNRLTSPLYALAYTLLALAALLSGDFNRRGQSRRVFIAVLLAIALQSLALMFQNLSAREPAMTPLMYLNAIAPIIIASWWLFSHRPGRRRNAAAWLPAR